LVDEIEVGVFVDVLVEINDLWGSHIRIIC
jgi:hypothetical protein